MNSMKLAARLHMAAAAVALAAAAQEFSGREGEWLDVPVGEQPRLRYMYAFDDSTPARRHDTYKVYCHVLGVDGDPITKGPGGQFTHHRGIFLGWSKMRFGGTQYDLWHMKNGVIRHREFLRRESGPQKHVLAVRLEWLTKDGEVMLEERRTFTVHRDAPDAWLLLDTVCDLTAVNGPVVLDGDPEHAGFQYRPHNAVAENKSARYVFPTADTDPRRDLDLPWVALTYELNGQTWSVQHMNHPGNPDGTRYSAYRNYGRFGAFAKTSVEAGETLVLRYRIRVLRGECPPAAVLEDEYRRYAAPYAAP